MRNLTSSSPSSYKFASIYISIVVSITSAVLNSHLQLQLSASVLALSFSATTVLCLNGALWEDCVPSLKQFCFLLLNFKCVSEPEVYTFHVLTVR